MNARNKKRAAILNRMNRVLRVRQTMRENNVSARQVADAMLSLEAHFVEVLGGPAHFTGNNRVFANGALAAEVRCRKCSRTFWVTALPHALCPDCDDSVLR